MVEKEKDMIVALRGTDLEICLQAAEALEKCRDEIERLRAMLRNEGYSDADIAATHWVSGQGRAKAEPESREAFEPYKKYDAV